MKKYRIDKNDSLNICGKTVYRVVALADFGKVKAGELGGFVESEKNLSRFGDCWIGGKAVVFDRAFVKDNAVVTGFALIHGRAVVCENAFVTGGSGGIENGSPLYGLNEFVEIGGFAIVSGNACVRHGVKIIQNANVKGYANLSNTATVKGYAEVSGNARVSGYARIVDHALVCGNATVKGNAFVKNSAVVNGNAIVSGDAVVMGSYVVGGRKRVSKGVLSGLRDPDLI